MICQKSSRKSSRKSRKSSRKSRQSSRNYYFNNETKKIQYNLSKKYFDFLSMRTKTKTFERKKLKF